MPADTALAVPIEQVVTDDCVIIARNHQPDNPVASFAYRDESGYRLIGINTAISPRRQRFAIAHAYSHLLAHSNRQPLIVCRQIRLDPPEPGTAEPPVGMEREANDNAAELLMPEGPLREELGRQVEARPSSRDQLIERMAARFEVSNEAMGWRLMTLTLIAG